MKWIFTFILFACIDATAQSYPVTQNLTLDTSQRTYLQNSPTNTFGNRRELIMLKDSSTWMNFVNRNYFYSLRGTPNMGTPTSFLWVSSDSGRMMASPISVMDSRYYLKSDTFPTGTVMTTSAATTAIDGLNASVNGKVPQSRTITINGVTQDLSANRTWSISAGSGTVTSVGLTVPSAFSVSGSPVTSSGTLAITGAGTSGQYVRGDGVLDAHTSTTAYGAGTAYTLTTTSAKITFGTTSPSITLPSAGTYLIIPQLKINYVGVTTLSVGDCSFKVRRINNTAGDLANSTTAFTIPILTLLTSTAGDADYPAIVYTTANSGDTIELWGNRPNTLTVGSVQVSEASIVAIKLY